MHETSGRTRDGRGKAQEGKDDARHEQDADEAQHAVGRLEACKLCKGDALRHGNGDNPAGGGHGRIGDDLLLAVLFRGEVAILLLLHLREAALQQGGLVRLMHRFSLGGGDDEAILVDDDTRALPMVLQIGNARGERVEGDV